MTPQNGYTSRQNDEQPHNGSQGTRRSSRRASERTPLLKTVAPIPDPTAPTPKPHTHAPPPLPMLQIIILCTVRTVEPIIFFSIFPYIAQMVSDNGHLPPSDVGFWSGLIESIFSLTQMFTLIIWGRMADRVGRKPTLLVSLLGMAVCPILFGMSRSLWEMMLFRAVAGCFTGSTLVVRTMMSDLSTVETQAKVFSWFAVAGNIGIFLGPIIGGALVDPADQYPNVFGHIAFFHKHPYALPGFVTAGICLICLLLNAILVKETLHKKPRDVDDNPTATTNNGTSSGTTENRSSIWSLFKNPKVVLVLYVYNHVMALAFSFTALLAVYLYTPVSLGGIGFSNFHISIYIAVQGAAQAIWLLLIFPILQRRLGTKRVLLLCGGFYPFFFSGYPVLNFLLRANTKFAAVVFWTLGPIVAIVGPGVSMAFTGVQLALNDVSPNPQVLGTLNALALTLASAVRTIVPGGTTALFAIGVRGHILGGQMIWAIMIPFAAATWVVCKWLPEGKTRAEEENEEDEE